MPTVRPAATHELPTVGAVLAAAFADDPVWQWLAADGVDWDERATAWFVAEVRSHAKGPGEVLVDDDLHGAALWSPPKRWRPPNSAIVGLAIPSVRLFGRKTPRVIRFMRGMEAVHPHQEHWYLAILGTHPAHQGHGVGSALVAAVTDRCDEEGIPSYLESSKEQNLAFYARHGYDVRAPIGPAGGPPVWPMWREPKG